MRFNTSSPFFENQYIKTTYSPVVPGDQGLDYTSSQTTLWSDGPFLTVIVRDFKEPMPITAYVQEIDTLSEFFWFVPRQNLSVHYFSDPHYFTNGMAFDYENELVGALTSWPSDQIEVIILGNLPSYEIWIDIKESIQLLR